MQVTDRQKTSMTNVSRVCGKCGRKIFADAPQGFCSLCLFKTGLGLLLNEDDEPLGSSAARVPMEFDDYKEDVLPDSMAPGDERFGVYEIERREDGSLYELGRGAMGVTYRATDTLLQRKVALKIITTGIAGAGPESFRGTEVRARFMREASGAGALRHDNVAIVCHFGTRV